MSSWKGILDLVRMKVPFGIFPALLPMVMLVPHVDWLEFFLVLLAGFLGVLGTHVADDIQGYKSGVDIANAAQKEEIGHPKALVKGEVSLKFATGLMITLFISPIVIGLILIFALGNSIWVLILGLFTLFWGYSYSGPPLKLSYRGLGESVLVIGAGIMPFTISYIVLADSFTWEVVWVGAFIGGIFSSVLMSAQMADIDGDLEGGRNTLTALIYKRWGEHGVVVALPFYHSIWFIMLGTAVFAGVVTPWLLLVLPLVFLYLMQYKPQIDGRYYDARNACLRNWRLIFFVICIIYLLA